MFEIKATRNTSTVVCPHFLFCFPFLMHINYTSTLSIHIHKHLYKVREARGGGVVEDDRFTNGGNSSLTLQVRSLGSMKHSSTIASPSHGTQRVH